MSETNHLLNHHQHDDDEPAWVSLQPPLLRRVTQDDLVSPPPLYKLTQRGNIDTTPGSDQVDNFRPRHFLSGPETREYSSSPHSPIAAIQPIPNKHPIDTTHFTETSASPLRVSVLENEEEEEHVVHRQHDTQTNHTPADAEKSVSPNHKNATSSFCGLSLSTDMTLCCDAMDIRDKLQYLFPSPASNNKMNLHKTLSVDDDDETYPEDNDETVNGDNVSLDKVDDPFVWKDRPQYSTEASALLSYQNHNAHTYDMPCTKETDMDSTVMSTCSHDTSQSAVSKSPRRLRLARLHKQRVHQHKSTNPLSMIP